MKLTKIIDLATKRYLEMGRPLEEYIKRSLNNIVQDTFSYGTTSNGITRMYWEVYTRKGTLLDKLSNDFTVIHRVDYDAETGEVHNNEYLDIPSGEVLNIIPSVEITNEIIEYYNEITTK